MTRLLHSSMKLVLPVSRFGIGPPSDLAIAHRSMPCDSGPASGLDETNRPAPRQTPHGPAMLGGGRDRVNDPYDVAVVSQPELFPGARVEALCRQPPRGRRRAAEPKKSRPFSSSKTRS